MRCAKQCYVRSDALRVQRSDQAGGGAAPKALVLQDFKNKVG
jgi:hypothetical protein